MTENMDSTENMETTENMESTENMETTTNTETALQQTGAFLPTRRRKAEEIAKVIDVADSQAIITFGLSAQKDISSFSDTVLNQIRSKDGGCAGEILTDLVLKIKDLDVDGLADKFGFLSCLLGGLKARFARFMEKYEKLSVQIEKIIDDLEKTKMKLLRDITLLDSMYDKNLRYIENLDVYIAAGALKLDELYNKVVPQLKAKAEQTQDPADAQQARDFVQLASRFEQKLHDLKLSRAIAIQTGPQLRIIQGNDSVLTEKIQSSILNTIPLWKNQIVIAISLFRQQDALKLQKKVADATNELLLKNSEKLKDNSIGVAKQTERGIVELETLKKVNADLIETIEETLRIQSEGKTKRTAAEQELAAMEKDFRERLLQQSR
jgi:uncharacterized protein YaaN involved in tellurite resistance